MRYNEFKILLEYRRDVTATKMGPQLLQAADRDTDYKDAHPTDQLKRIDYILEKLESMDPTRNKTYVPWIARQYINGQIRLSQGPEITDTLNHFIDLKPRLRSEQRDINRFKFQDLKKLIDEIMKPTIGVNVNSRERFSVVEDSKVLYNGPLGQLAIPETEEASCELGRGTKWCTAATDSPNLFDRFSREGPLYVWRDKNGEKYQFWFPLKVTKDSDLPEYKDSSDETIDAATLAHFRESHPVVKQIFQNYEKFLLNHLNGDLIYLYTMSIAKRWPEGEEIIAEDPYNAYRYALNVIKGPFPLGEKAIAETSQFTFSYVKHVLRNKPFPLGEKQLAKDADQAYWYASKIIKGPWPPGEPVISESPMYSFWYAYNVLHSRFPMGEDAIAEDPSFALDYVRLLVRGRWPKGEAAIRSDEQKSQEYDIFLKDKP